jgi:hypothetical protein
MSIFTVKTYKDLEIVNVINVANDEPVGMGGHMEVFVIQSPPVPEDLRRICISPEYGALALIRTAIDRVIKAEAQRHIKTL